MNTYCVGFCFSYDLKKVALIRKAKPQWQRGKLNGVGGSVEPGETFRAGMQREWMEEAGVPLSEEGWELVAEIRGPDYIIAVYKYRLMIMEPRPFLEAVEQVDWFQTHSLATRMDLIPNLHWLIPLCLDEAVNFPIMVINK